MGIVQAALMGIVYTVVFGVIPVVLGIVFTNETTEPQINWWVAAPVGIAFILYVGAVIGVLTFR